MKFGLVKKFDPADKYNFQITFEPKIIHEAINFHRNQEVYSDI